MMKEERDFGCPGCDAQPGDGYTADCHHPEGCGYWKSSMGALSNRLGVLKDRVSGSDRIWCEHQVDDIHKQVVHGSKLLRRLHTCEAKARFIAARCECFGRVELEHLGGKSYVIRVEFL